MYNQFSLEKLILVIYNPRKFGIGNGDTIELIFDGDNWRAELDKQFQNPDIEINFGVSDE